MERGIVYVIIVQLLKNMELIKMHLTQDMALEILIAEQAEHYRQAPEERRDYITDETLAMIKRIHPEDSEQYGFYVGLYSREIEQ